MGLAVFTFHLKNNEKNLTREANINKIIKIISLVYLLSPFLVSVWVCVCVSLYI